MSGSLHRSLALLLTAIQTHAENYPMRYGLVLAAMATADDLGMRTGYRIDSAEPEWPVAFIELDEGQISWHMPAFPAEWDGHSTDEKDQRIQRFIERWGTPP